MAERVNRKIERPYEFYKPLPHQERFHASKAKFKLFCASNRSGKTEANVAQCVRRALGVDPHRPDFPVPNYGWVISVSNDAQRDILQPKFLKYIPRDSIANIIKRPRGVWDQIIFKNGSVMGFKSCEMDRKVFQGTALHWLSCDEEASQDVLEEALTRLTDYGGDAWMTMTPINGMTYTYDWFVDPETRRKDCEVFSASMWDNAKSVGGHIADVDIKAFEESISDPVMRDIRIYGQYRSQVGRIYKSFDKKTHGIQELPRQFLNENGTIASNYDTYVTIDPGGRSFAAGFFLVDYFGNIFMFDEFFNDVSVNKGTDEGTTSARARAILRMCSEYGIWPDFTMDPSSQFVMDFSEYGIPCALGDNNPDTGIPTVMEYMSWDRDKQIGPKYKNPKFYVVLPKCPRFIYEVDRYQWDAPAKSGSAMGEKKNKPRKKDDHIMDVLKYTCMIRPDPSKPAPGSEDDRPDTLKIRDQVKRRIRDSRNNSGDGGDPSGLDDY